MHSTLKLMDTERKKYIILTKISGLLGGGGGGEGGGLTELRKKS